MGTGQYLQREYYLQPLRLHVLTLGPYSGNALCSAFTGTNTIASTAWPANNRAIYYPLNMPAYFTVARFMVGNGSNATGNIDIGLFNGAGAKLISTGTQSRTGTTVIQYYGVTDQTFPPGHYYIGLVASSTTGQYLRAANGLFDIAGILQEDLGSTVLPTTMTPVTVTAGAYFAFGFTQSDTL